MENIINKNLTTVIAENRQDKEFYDENIYYNAAVESQTELEDRTVIDTEEGSTTETVEKDKTETLV